jgi:hypothetical protein
MIMAIGKYGFTAAIAAAIASAFLFGTGLGEARASAGCTAVNQGTWDISASNNGSNEAGGVFATGDSLSFTFVGDAEYEFLGSLMNGGVGEVDEQQTVTFTATYGDGDLAVSAPGDNTFIEVVAASCTPGPVPTVTSVSPGKGPTTGLNQVVITGSGFSGDLSNVVKFGNNSSCCVIGFSGTTQLTVLPPAGTGTVDVTVSNDAGTSATTAADHYSYVYPLAHDFNGDGVSDILWGDGSGDMAMWLMQAGQNAGQILSDAALGNVGTSWSVVGTRDFNGDGTADILWHDTAGDLGIWLMNGTSVSSYSSLGNVGTQWSVVGTGYFDGLPAGDILWRNTSTGDLAIWLMSDGQLLSGVDFGVVPLAWQVAGTGDFNADGTTDILWRNSQTGDLAIWFMENNEGQLQVLSTVDLGAVALNWLVVGTGDFNGDDTADILWRNSSNGELAIWLMSNGQMSSSANIARVPLTWSVAEVGDFNGDGKSDILWLDTAGDLGVWLMNGLSVGSAIGLGNVGTTWQVQGQNAD